MLKRLVIGSIMAKNWPINALITQKYGILGGPLTVNFSLGPTPQIGMSSIHLGGDPPPDFSSTFSFKFWSVF